MQGTRVQALVWELRSHMPWSNKPAHRDYWSPRAWSLCPATGEATAVRSPCATAGEEPHLLQLEKACTQQGRAMGCNEDPGWPK